MNNYGVNLNMSIAINDGDTSIGLHITDSNGAEYDRQFDNVDLNNAPLLLSHSIMDFMCDAEKALAEQNRKAAEEEKARRNADEFLNKQEVANSKLDELYRQIEDLTAEVESYKIDNNILRMRNEKLMSKNAKNDSKTDNLTWKEDKPAKKYDNKIHFNAKKSGPMYSDEFFDWVFGRSRL